jgi:hypothetical protein
MKYAATIENHRREMTEDALREWHNELFRVQCCVLALGTHTGLSAPELRLNLMALRQEIIEFRERRTFGDLFRKEDQS